MKHILIAAMVLYLVPSSALADELKFSSFSGSSSDYLVTTDSWKRELAASGLTVGEIEQLIWAVNNLSRQVNDLQKHLERLQKQANRTEAQVERMQWQGTSILTDSERTPKQQVK